MDFQASVGPDNIEGYEKVQALADYLVSLRQGSMALTNSQADEIIRLWNNLHDVDKMTKFSPRHRTMLTKGKFKASKKRKKNTVTPGLDSTKR